MDTGGGCGAFCSTVNPEAAGSSPVEPAINSQRLGAPSRPYRPPIRLAVPVLAPGSIAASLSAGARRSAPLTIA